MDLSRVVVFGTGKIAERYALAMGKRVAYYVDNDAAKQGTAFMGKPVRSPSVLLDDKDVMIVVATKKYSDEIIAQLNGMGLGKRLTTLPDLLLPPKAGSSNLGCYQKQGYKPTALANLETVFANGLTRDGSFDCQMVAWLNGIRAELEFWQVLLFTYVHPRLSVKSVPVSPSMCLHLSAGDRVLDCGASLSSTLGNTLPSGERIDLVAVDPLAAFYDRMLNELGQSSYVRTTFGMVELLDDIFPPASFDLAYMRNALDHSYDPVVGIKQLLNMVPVGGRVFLAHIRNEAEHAQHTGFHQWNMDIDGGDFIIWNAEHRNNITEMLRGYADVEVELSSDTPPLVNAILTRKTAELFDVRDDKRRILDFFVRALGAMTIDTRGRNPFGGLLRLLG